MIHSDISDISAPSSGLAAYSRSRKCQYPWITQSNCDGFERQGLLLAVFPAGRTESGSPDRDTGTRKIHSRVKFTSTWSVFLVSGFCKSGGSDGRWHRGGTSYKRHLPAEAALPASGFILPGRASSCNVHPPAAGGDQRFISDTGPVLRCALMMDAISS